MKERMPSNIASLPPARGRDPLTELEQSIAQSVGLSALLGEKAVAEDTGRCPFSETEIFGIDLLRSVVADNLEAAASRIRLALEGKPEPARRTA